MRIWLTTSLTEDTNLTLIPTQVYGNILYGWSLYAALAALISGRDLYHHVREAGRFLSLSTALQPRGHYKYACLTLDAGKELL